MFGLTAFQNCHRKSGLRDIAVCMWLIICACSPGVAKAGSYGHDAPPPSSGGSVHVANGDSESASIVVEGRVTGRCQFMSGNLPASTTSLAIQTGSHVELPFRIYCNSGFRLSVNSRNGGILSTGPRLSQASLDAGFKEQMAYRARLEVQRDDGSTLSEDCYSANLLSGHNCAMASANGLSSRIAATNRAGKLVVDLDSVDPSHMVAGAYADVITINVQARL